jgi:formylglycine-generating enzyme required for sulfatase activity
VFLVLARPGAAPPDAQPPSHPPVVDASRSPRIRLPDGREVELRLWKLPGEAGDLELVSVPAGDFTMGVDDPIMTAEGPRHTHRMDHAYWIGRTPITWRVYLTYCAATGAPVPERPEWVGDDHPVVSVSWEDAHGFCSWAKVALPTAAEWEKAARGPRGFLYPWGDSWDGMKCNHGRAAKPSSDASDGYEYSSPVGAFPAGVSDYGALDMAGNASQWCEDVYDEKAHAHYLSGEAAPDNRFRVIRGGSWGGDAGTCRSTYFVGVSPAIRSPQLGFRVVVRSP